MTRMVKANPQTEAAELTAMEEKIFLTDRFTNEAWANYSVFWIVEDERKVGILAFDSHKAPGASIDEDEESPGTLWIVNLGILPEFRSKGFGRFALKWVIGWAGSTKGLSRVVSNFRVTNRSSRVVHQSCGFKHAKTICGYYRDPHEDAKVVEVVLDEL